MNKTIIYLACYFSSEKHPWFSTGGQSKVMQTLNILKSSNKNLIFANQAPNNLPLNNIKSLNICNYFNKYIYSFEILFSFCKIKNLMTKEEKKFTMLVYNPRFSSLLFFISAHIFGYKPSLVIQIEDMPGARKNIFTFIDKISFRFLILFAKHLFFASEGMMKNFRKKYHVDINQSVYPPCLSKDFIKHIKKRSKPFKEVKLKIMYAGGCLKEKGVYDLIEAFEKAKIEDSILNIYGKFPKNIKIKYLSNKNIIFHGFVNQEQLYIAYANTDIIVNPHKFILNNHLIFPYKNIEIFSSGALPLVSENSILGFNSLKIKDLSVFKDVNQLSQMLKNAPKTWQKNNRRFETSSNSFINIYSEERVNKNFQNIIYSIN